VRRPSAILPRGRRLLGQREPFADVNSHSDATRLGHANLVTGRISIPKADAERNQGTDSDSRSDCDREPFADSATSYAYAVRHANASVRLAH
jgi:hypothetical protein